MTTVKAVREYADRPPPDAEVAGVPPEVTAKWQRTTDLLAEWLDVPVVLVMQAGNACMTVSVAGHTLHNPYRPGDAVPWADRCGQAVIQRQEMLIVPNALDDPVWNKNTGDKEGMIAYMGLPVNAPGGRSYGVLCVLDRKERHFSEHEVRVLQIFRGMLEDDLAHRAADLQAERRREALQASEARYRALIESSCDLIWMLKPDGVVSYMSPSWKTVLGYDPAPLIGKAFQSLVHPDDLAACEDYLARGLLARESLPGLEYRVMHADESWRWHEGRITPVHAGDGTPLHVVGVSRDITDRKQAEEELEQQRRRLESVIRGTHSATYEWNVQTGEYIFDQPWVDMLGYDGSELPPLTIESFMEVVHPDDQVRVRRLLHEHFEGALPVFHCEYRAKHRQGGWVWMQDRGQVLVRSGDGQPLIMCGMLADITERKLAEQQIHDNEARLESLVRILQHSSQDELSFLDYVLDEAIDLTDSKIGYIYFYDEEKQEFRLNTWSKGVMEMCSIAARREAEPLAATGLWGEAVRQRKEIVVNDFQAHHPSKKGYPQGHAPLHRFLTVPVFSAERIVAVVGVANKESDYDNTDVLQLKLLMDSVWRQVELMRGARERQRLLTAIEQTDDVVVITDTSGAIEYVNAAFVKVTGYTRAEALGRNPRLLKSGKQDAAFYRALWATLTKGDIWKGQLVNQRKDGTLFTEDATISPVKDEAGHVVSYLAVKRNVTEYLHMQEANRKLEEQFRQSQKMESVGRLAGGVAHDFNNMLQAIMGYTEMAMDQTPPGGPLHADLEEIWKVADRSADLTRQLLAFARKQAIAPRLLSLNDTVEDLLKLLRRLIGEDVDLVWKPGHDRSTVRMDPSQLDQLLANLCVNARDAIDGVGEIIIETDHVTIDEEYAVTHLDAQPGEYVLLAVSDTGCGISEEVRNHLFEPFFTTKEVGEGTGLGLATVYGIVRQNEGFINVYSEPGRGTTFRIYLPRSPGEFDEEAQHAAAPDLLQGAETVLLVEDEASVRRTTVRTLEQMGYTVLEAAAAETALPLAEQYPGTIHLLLMDVILPGLSGREVADRLTAVRPAMQVIYMSGYTANVISRHGVLDPDVTFLAKPFTRLALLQTVRKALDTPPAS